MAKKNSSLLLATAAVVILCAAVVIITKKNGKQAVQGENVTASVQDQDAASDQDDGSAVVIQEDGALMIPVSEVTSDASFYPVEVDGAIMEVIAVKDSTGYIRTAFNTCQICYGSGRGYYVQQGETLVCQNCGNRFTMDQIEIESGGCNPWPIFEENKTVTEEYVEISYDFLKESKDIFANWKQAG